MRRNFFLLGLFLFFSITVQGQTQNTPLPPCYAPLRQQVGSINETFGREDITTVTRQWLYIRQALACYYKSNRNVLASKAFSHNMFELSELSYQHRGENGGFAKGFVREAFLKAAISVMREAEFWRVPLTPDQRNLVITKLQGCFVAAVVGDVLTDRVFDLMGNGLSGLCLENATVLASESVGDNHFTDHLKVAFYSYINREFVKTARSNPASQVEQKLWQRMIEISKEHEMQFTLALVPAINKVTELPWVARKTATVLIPERARGLRYDMFRRVLGELKLQNLLSPDAADRLIDVIPSSDAEKFPERMNATIPQTLSLKTESKNFQVTTKTSTAIRVKQGDIISISASGVVLLGMFAGKSGPDGIDGLQAYSVVKTARHGALLARVRVTGNESWVVIGSQGSFVAGQAGIVELMVNDADPSNNAGYFSVSVTVQRK